MYTEKIRVTRGIFHGIPLESVSCITSTYVRGNSNRLPNKKVPIVLSYIEKNQNSCCTYLASDLFSLVSLSLKSST